MDKIAQLQIPDTVYNWLVNFFDGHMSTARRLEALDPVCSQ